MVLVQKWPFFQPFFYPIYARKMSFEKFQNEKALYYAIKTKSSKSRKIDIFPKWLTHSFGPKMAIFQLFLLYAIKTRNSKSRKIDIFAKGLTSGIGQKWPFLNLFFQAIQARKMFFTIFQNKKTPFQAIKTRSL